MIKPRSKINSLSESIEKKLSEAAHQVFPHAHAPYSKFKVGAAVIDEKGRIFSGCNVENASYGATVCAERVAIFSAVAAGAKSIAGVLVLTDVPQPSAPCGMCRQVLLEFSSPTTPVVLESLKGAKQRLELSQLCPFPFTPSDLRG